MKLGKTQGKRPEGSKFHSSLIVVPSGLTRRLAAALCMNDDKSRDFQFRKQVGL